MAGGNLAFGIPIFARAVWGRAKFTPGPFYTGRFSIPIAFAAVIFQLYGIVLAMFPTAGPNPTAEDMNYTVVVDFAVWGGCTVYYFLNARKWFTGPKTTVDEMEVVPGRSLTDEQQAELPGDSKVAEAKGSGGYTGVSDKDAVVATE